MPLLLMQLGSPLPAQAPITDSNNFALQNSERAQCSSAVNYTSSKLCRSEMYDSVNTAPLPSLFFYPECGALSTLSYPFSFLKPIYVESYSVFFFELSFAQYDACEGHPCSWSCGLIFAAVQEFVPWNQHLTESIPLWVTAGLFTVWSYCEWCCHKVPSACHLVNTAMLSW